MKLEKREGTTERTILTGMVVSTSVLSRIALKWKSEGLFRSTLSNIVGGWCVKYFQRHSKAPGKDVVNLFSRWAQDREGDQDTVKLVQKYLESLSGEYSRLRKSINSEFVLDLAGEHFNSVYLEKLGEYIQGCKDSGKVEDAWKKVQQAHKVEIGVGAGIDVFQNAAEMRDSIEGQQDSVLFRYPGALGRFFGDSLEREGFLAFLGPEKRGKTWWLIDLAWRAMLQRKRVAFFEVGDLSKKQLLRRFYTRALGRPLKQTREGRHVLYPTDLVLAESEGPAKAQYDVKTMTRQYDEPATWMEVQRAMKRIQDDRIRSDSSYLRCSIHPNSSINVAGLRSIIDEWMIDNWIPEVIVIDYADILAQPTGFRGESRDAVNDNWKAMRRMSQELHGLVVTATQANAASYTSDQLGMSNFSEDKRKFSHVTGMIGINQTNPEKVIGVQRLNWLVLREDEFIVTQEVAVAGCLAIANPALRSIM